MHDLSHWARVSCGLSRVWHHSDCTTSIFRVVAKSATVRPSTRNTFFGARRPPWAALHNLCPGALSGCHVRPFLCNSDPARPARAAARARRAPSFPPCRAARLASIERAPPPRGVAQSGSCPRPRTAQVDRLSPTDPDRRRAEGRETVGRAPPPHGALSVDRRGVELVTAEVAREIRGPARPNNFPPSLDAGQSSGGRRTARGARLLHCKESRPACSRATRAVPRAVPNTCTGECKFTANMSSEPVTRHRPENAGSPDRPPRNVAFPRM